MSEEKIFDEIEERESTKPDVDLLEVPKKVLKQVPVRMHEDEHARMMATLKKDELSLQRFITYCIRSYLSADPVMLKLVRYHREMDAIAARGGRGAGLWDDQKVLSLRDRMSIFDEIEKGKK